MNNREKQQDEEDKADAEKATPGQNPKPPVESVAEETDDIEADDPSTIANDEEKSPN